MPEISVVAARSPPTAARHQAPDAQRHHQQLMVEISLVASKGLPERAVFSMRNGASRRQQPLPLKAPFALPGPPGPYQLDFFEWSLWSKTKKELPQPDASGCFKVKLYSASGAQPATVSFKRVERSDAEQRPLSPTKSEAEEKLLGGSGGPGGSSLSPTSATRTRTRAQIDEYCAKHGINDFLRDLYQDLFAEQPEDPYAFIADRFKQAAAKEMEPGLTSSMSMPKVGLSATKLAHKAAGFSAPAATQAQAGTSGGCRRARDLLLRARHPRGGLEGALLKLRGRALRQRAVDALLAASRAGNLEAIVGATASLEVGASHPESPSSVAEQVVATRRPRTISWDPVGEEQEKQLEGRTPRGGSTSKEVQDGRAAKAAAKSSSPSRTNKLPEGLQNLRSHLLEEHRRASLCNPSSDGLSESGASGLQAQLVASAPGEAKAMSKGLFALSEKPGGEGPLKVRAIRSLRLGRANGRLPSAVAKLAGVARKRQALRGLLAGLSEGRLDKVLDLIAVAA